MDGFLKAVPEGGGGTMVDSLLGLVPPVPPKERRKIWWASPRLLDHFSPWDSPSMILKFLPVLEKYIGAKGCSGLAGLFGSLFGGASK